MNSKVQKYEDDISILDRVNYYNQLDHSVTLNQSARKLTELSIKDGRTYYFDLYEYARYFDQSLRGNFLFGDITNIPPDPSFVKSRPINKYNQNSILLKWNKVRHYIFVKNDPTPFSNKRNELVWRGNVFDCQSQRIRFLEKYFEEPMCNIGKVNPTEGNSEWIVDKMTIDQQLAYKYILCIEGNDVASNLKWVMSSRSLAVMPKPKFETWFMEGRLVPNYHYIEIKDDYSNLLEKMEYFNAHPDEAKAIVKNANKFVDHFKDEKVEGVISLMVMKKYFDKTE